MADVAHLVAEDRRDLVLVEVLDQGVGQQHVAEPRQGARHPRVDDRAVGVPDEDVGEAEAEPVPRAARVGRGAGRRERAGRPGQADERRGDHEQDRPHRGHHPELHHRRRGRLAQAPLARVAPRPRRGTTAGRIIPNAIRALRSRYEPAARRRPDHPRGPRRRIEAPPAERPPPSGTARGSSARRRRTRRFRPIPLRTKSGQPRPWISQAKTTRFIACTRYDASQPAPGRAPSDIPGVGPAGGQAQAAAHRHARRKAQRERPSRSGSSPGPRPARAGTIESAANATNRAIRSGAAGISMSGGGPSSPRTGRRGGFGGPSITARRDAGDDHLHVEARRGRVALDGQGDGTTSAQVFFSWSWAIFGSSALAGSVAASSSRQAGWVVPAASALSLVQRLLGEQLGRRVLGRGQEQEVVAERALAQVVAVLGL